MAEKLSAEKISRTMGRKTWCHIGTGRHLEHSKGVLP